MSRTTAAGVLLGVLVAVAFPRGPEAQEKRYLFVDEVRFKGFPTDQERKMRTWGSGLAAELCAALRDAGEFMPMTLENMEAQLGKEKLKQTLACEDTACVNRVVENFGISESVFGVVRWIARDNVQVTLVRMAGGEKIADMKPRYIDPGFKAIAGALAEMAQDLTADGMSTSPRAGVENRIPVAVSPAPASSPVTYSDALRGVRQIQETQRRLDAAWAEVSQVALEKRVGVAERVSVLQRFLADFPGDNIHREHAEQMIHVLQRGEEPTNKRFVSPERRRTKTEWMAFRVNGGTYGGGATMSLFTLRWRWFFWEILRGGGGAGADDGGNDVKWWGIGGMMWGVPWYLDQLAKHELRFGLGLAGGVVQGNGTWDGDDHWYDNDLSVGPFLIPEVTYVWHSGESFALQAGLNLIISTLAVDGSVPAPILNFFLGFRI